MSKRQYEYIVTINCIDVMFFSHKPTTLEVKKKCIILISIKIQKYDDILQS